MRILILSSRLLVLTFLLEDEIAKLRSKLHDIEENAKKVEKHCEELEKKLSLVSSSCEGYLNIRNRFLAVFRRDILEQRSAVDRQVILNGNTSSHDGDALSDALLFERGMRSDPSTYHLLYGFSPEVVRKLGVYS